MTDIPAALKAASDAAAAAIKPLSREQRGVVLAGLFATHVAEQAMLTAEGTITFDQKQLMAGLSTLFLDAAETVGQATDLLTRAAASIAVEAMPKTDPAVQ